MAVSAEHVSAELEAVGSNKNSVSPSTGGSGYQTPRASMSRRTSSRPTSRRQLSSRGGSSSPPLGLTSSPPPLPTSSPGTTQNEDGTNDDDLLDIRRFTPTLQASLVSEILNLRRELDSKHKFIEDLESNLHSAKTENEDISEKLALSDKDRKYLKRHLQQLEHGTLSALEELAKDRDDVKKQSSDLRSKLDEALEKLKRREEESERTHAAWEKDQNAWETERRAYERRGHVTETRLKQVLTELEAVHQAQAQVHEQHVPGEDDDQARDSGLGDESDTASQASPMRNATSHNRTMSNSSRRSFGRYRFSVQSVPGADGGKINGISLADELQLDEEDEEDLVSEAESEQPRPETPAKKGIVALHSQFFDEKAKRLGGAEQRRKLQSPVEFEPSKGRDSPTVVGAMVDRFKPTVKYVDTGVQYTPLSSPKAETNKETTSKEVQTTSEYRDTGIQYEPMEFEEISGPMFGKEHRKDSKVDVEDAKELRRNIVTPPPMVDRGQQMSPIPSPKKRASMVSAASQTVDEPLSPPATPGVSPPSSPMPVVDVHLPPAFSTISTQTDFADEQKALSKSRPAPLVIPSINIVPPPSAPSSPKEPKLPPGTKNAECQTTSDLISRSSVSVQTEEIRIDTRLAKLPPHLHPSAISSNPPTPEHKSRPFFKRGSSLGQQLSEDEIPSSPPQLPSPVLTKRNDIRATSDSSTSPRTDDLRRLLKSAVFGTPFDNDYEKAEREDSRADFLDNEQKVSTYSTPNMSGRVMKHMRSRGTRPSPVPEEKDELEHERSPELPSHPEPVGAAVTSGRSSVDTSASTDKAKGARTQSVKSSNSSKLRRSAMIQSSNAAHRSRTPSIVSVGSSSFFSTRSGGPPFPVPDRGSSRKLFASRSEGSSSPTPRSGVFNSKKRGNATVGRKDSLRKVRSATVIQRSNSRGKSRSRSRSPPLQPHRFSPTYPPLPQDNVAIPPRFFPSQKSGEKRLSQRATSPEQRPELSRASQGTVVDAIAATMVGEWMWKYVRRRTSFGVPESSQEQLGRPGTDGTVNITGNGVRHKRWVWLSPYERAIMWSSKQPASNSALLGKSGRKLVIQSVLDVRDDTPLPKNHGIAEPFNRSILILTPARALKFTAMSRERHYTWLTALSFLAHSPLLAPGLAPLPPIPQEQPEPPKPRAQGLKRGGIRDSVRIAKDRARPTMRSTKSEPPSGTIPEIEFEAAFGTGNAAPIPSIPDVAAEPPTVPRFTHGRNRSLTGPKLPSATLRSLGYKEIPSPSFPISSLPSPSIDYASTRVSEASTSTRTAFLDTVGTIRMEAFINQQTSGGGIPCYSPPPSGGRRRGNSAVSPQFGERKRSGMILGDDFDVGVNYDPFKDFAR